MSSPDRAGLSSGGIEAPLCSTWRPNRNPGLGERGGSGRKDNAVTETRNFLVSRAEPGIAACKDLPGLRTQASGKEEGGLMQLRGDFLEEVAW